MPSDETSEGANYLSGLKRSSSPAGAAAARSSDVPRPSETGTGVATPASKTAFTGAESRKSPRYRCKGSARLQELGGTVSTWATFADISMHGCYVETSTPHPAGTTLSLTLDANGFRIEATGEVRVSYPSLGMGVSFSKMSDEDRERLRQLMRSISRPSVIVGSRLPARPVPISQPEPLRSIANPEAILQAMQSFFEDRHMMGREEFLRILRKGQ
jgi:PilZ domain-containing protein